MFSNFLNNLSWLDYLFPRHNGVYSSIHSYLEDIEIQVCKPRFKKLRPEQSQVLAKVAVMSDYRQPLIEDLIQRAKFMGEWAITKDLANLIHQKVWVENEIFLPSPDAITYVPPDPLRHLQRGYHVPAKIAAELGRLTQLLVAPIIRKKKHTPAQVGLEKAQRLANLKGVFEIDHKSVQDNPGNWEVIWLVDDISSTGRTLEACARVIKTAWPHVQIYGVCVSGG